MKRKTPLRQGSAKHAAMSADKRRPAGMPLRRAISIKASTKRMRQGRSTSKPTARQVARFEHIRAIGCIASLLDGRPGVLPEVHHLNEGGYHGGKRRGHDFTIGLSRWHHQGIPPQGMNERQALAQLGPSYKLHKMAFRARYGNDDQLLETTNKLIALRELALAAGARG